MYCCTSSSRWRKQPSTNVPNSKHLLFIPATRQSSRAFSLSSGTEITALIRLSHRPRLLVWLLKVLVQKLRWLLQHQLLLLLRRRRLGCLLLTIRPKSRKLLFRHQRRPCRHTFYRLVLHQLVRGVLLGASVSTCQMISQARVQASFPESTRRGYNYFVLCFRLRTPPRAMTRASPVSVADRGNNTNKTVFILARSRYCANTA